MYLLILERECAHVSMQVGGGAEGENLQDKSCWGGHLDLTTHDIMTWTETKSDA